jgi:hypothetical protein
MLLTFSLLLLEPSAIATALDGKRQEAISVLRAVVAREAQDYGDIPGDVVPCVKPTIQETTFGHTSMVRMRLAPPATLQAPDIFAGPSWLPHWQRLNVDADRIYDVEEDEQQALSTAAAEVARDSDPPILNRVDKAWLEAPYRLCGSGDGTPSLEVTSPGIAGDLAFVSVSFDCVLCGHGRTYALRRIGPRWRIVAEVLTWVS